MKNLNYSDIPSSVYRIQFSREFTFKDAIAILPYLKSLGIEGIYCSPFFDAYTPHGYDITDPNRINPQIGTEEDYEDFCSQLKKNGLKQIIDVVPNHMGIKGGKNLWWQDILENGPYSEYAAFFDINWSSEKKELQDRVLLPILGNHYGVVLENQEIKLHFANGVFAISYGEYSLPVASHTYAILLEVGSEELQKKLGEESSDWKSYHELIEMYRFFPVAIHERPLKKKEGRERLLNLLKNKQIEKFLKNQVVRFNGKKRYPESFDHLDHLLEGQFYRLSFWKVAQHEINYRRFFNIHELVAIRIEEKQVLEAHHQWVFELISLGKVQGLRIDHPDGLYDPVSYFSNLQERFLILTIVEKILDRKEQLPEKWDVDGTVGYEYLNTLNGVFIRQDKGNQFTQIYEEFLGEKVDFEEILYASKKLFALYYMISEVEVLGLKLDRLSEHNRLYRDFTRFDLTRAIAEVIAYFPVYRSYIAPEGSVTKRDARYITYAIEQAKKHAKDPDLSVFDFLEKILLLKLKVRKEEQEAYREFVLRFQQLTGPIMAKGLEDTTFYLYNRFISLNEVGGDPPHFGHSLDDFYHFNQEKLSKWPLGFLCSSTHDTKRNEDIRMRLNILSEIPEQWGTEVKNWALLNAKHKSYLGPSLNVEYFIYQTLVGVWPKNPLKKKEWAPFVERIWEAILKAIREGNRESSWINPKLDYEESVRQFLYAILTPGKSNSFLRLFLQFQKEIDRFGSWNSLSATILKIASCGIVDIYQGNEIWNYRLVDPDNRKTVDFEIRKKILASIKQVKIENILNLSDHGKIKLYLHWKALNFRKENKSLFLEGEFIPLKVRGARKNHLIAFGRVHNKRILIVLAGRFFASLIPSEWGEPLGKIAWGDTEVILPKEWGERKWSDLFTEKNIRAQKHGNYLTLLLSEVFEHLPVSYLYG